LIKHFDVLVRLDAGGPEKVAKYFFKRPHLHILGVNLREGYKEAIKVM
jgi:hypothetical protein